MTYEHEKTTCYPGLNAYEWVTGCYFNTAIFQYGFLNGVFAYTQYLLMNYTYLTLNKEYWNIIIKLIVHITAEKL